MYRSTIIVFLLSSLCINPAICANVFITTPDIWPVVKIEGKIVKGDYLKVKQIVSDLVSDKDFYQIQFYLNSAGGDIEEAMKIGFLARELLAKVVVVGSKIVSPDSEDAIFVENYLKENPDEASRFQNFKTVLRGTPLKEEHLNRCYSACILIFYGGVWRDVSDNLDWRNLANKRQIPTIGIHRPYYDSEFFGQLSPSDARKEYKKLEVVVLGYLNEMGAPQSLIERMFSIGSDEIELIGYEEFKSMYQREAPYLTEWLLAKCGNPKIEGFLSKQELKDWQNLSKARDEKIKDFLTKGGEIDTDYMNYLRNHFIPEGLTEERIKFLRQKVKDHNRPIYECRRKSVTWHQLKWALEN